MPGEQNQQEELKELELLLKSENSFLLKVEVKYLTTDEIIAKISDFSFLSLTTNKEDFVKAAQTLAEKVYKEIPGRE